MFLAVNALKDMRPALSLAQASIIQVARAETTSVELDGAASVRYAMNHYPLVYRLTRAPASRV